MDFAPRMKQMGGDGGRIHATIAVPFNIKVTLSPALGSQCRLVGISNFRTVGCDTFSLRGSGSSGGATKLVFWLVADKEGTYPITIEHIDRDERVISSETFEINVRR